MGDMLAKPVTDKYSSSLENDLLAVGATGMQGWRKSMEDAHTTVLKLEGGPDGPCAFFGVFDGHCGHDSARYCGRLMHQKVASTEEFKKGCYEAALKRGFLDLDAELLKENAWHGSGCTAVCCLVTSDGRIIVGNAGDSRSVLSRGAQAHPLSFDHKPTDEKEKARIFQAGSFVSGGRVNGNLALSRAVGDFSFKQNAALTPEQQAITADPDVTTTTLTAEDDFIILACDGIWDVLNNEEAIDFVRNRIDRQEIAKVCEDVCDRYPRAFSFFLYKHLLCRKCLRRLPVAIDQRR
ncbi:putative protein phosphatase 2C T23F11.1 [Diplonema papillatum]|nr:putative protein phosphatase 2C T23F11.1 [Diplonema papillatum]